MKDFNVLIDNKNFLVDVPIKREIERYEKLIETSKNNNYATRHLLDYEYFSNHYKLIDIDLSKTSSARKP